MMVPLRSPRPLPLAALCVLVALPACASLLGLERGELGAESGAGGGGGGMGGGVDAGGGGSSSTGEMCGDPAIGERTGDRIWSSLAPETEYAIATTVAFGTSGDIFVGGTYLNGPIKFKGMAYDHDDTLGGPDVFLARYDMAGNPIWGIGFPGPGWQVIRSVATDPTNGDVLVAGWFEGSFSLPGTDAVDGEADAFVARFSKDGAPVWTKVFANADVQRGVKVAVDASGYTAFAMQGYGVLQLDAITKGADDGNNGFFVVKLDPEGLVKWAEHWRSDLYAGDQKHLQGDEVGLAFDSDRSLVIAGSATDDNVGSDDPFRGGTDVVVMKYDVNDVRKWARLFGGTSQDALMNGPQIATAVTTDCEGDVYIAGGFQADLELDELPKLAGTNGDGTYQFDAFVAKLGGADGKARWANPFRDAGLQLANAVAVDENLHVVVSGILVDDVGSLGVDFGGDRGAKQPSGPYPGDGDYYEDFFLVKLDAMGEHIWSDRYGDDSVQRGVAATGPEGKIAVAGDFFRTLHFDVEPDGAFSSNTNEMFVALFDP